MTTATAPLAASRPGPAPGFHPAWWARGGHVQTLLGYWARRRLRWTAPVEDLVVDLEPGVRLLVRASWQPHPAEAPTLVLLHGLNSCDTASYAISTGLLAWSRGWNVARVNMRGAGPGEALCARLYHAGMDLDLLAVLDALSSRSPRLGVVGVSLGANVGLLALGRRRDRLPPGLIGMVAICPPLDLAAAAAAIERPLNRLYLRYFMVWLRRTYRSRQRRLPDLYAAGREAGPRSIREWDDAITAPYGGFRDVDHYYSDSSAGPWLTEVRVPTLVLAAADDPMVPAESVTRWETSACVRREVTATGGHVGFVAPSAAPGRFWAGERALGFLASLPSGMPECAGGAQPRAARIG